ncbi:PAS domain-containing protein [Adhaeribacter swui]|uniref:histidine kinase n=1 Tax=Adhaeribacter swui TaxID=2086471 RepID=A0A7G7G503_9BACT|nr:PAS domain-containing protein [Adhaeribacter swui]QNF32237.1 PAS domain-containing protein [Adhaeribacter swui]
MDALKLFHNSPENLIVVSPEYKILDATNAYLQVTRRQREEIVGLHFLLEAYPDPNYTFEENPVRISFEKVLQTKKVDYMELVSYRIALPEFEGGGFYDSYWEASHTPVLDDAGNIEYIIQKTIDVTERELARQARVISEKKFKFLMDTIPQVIFTTDGAGKVNHINKRLINYTGISEEEGYSPDFDWSTLVHPEDLPRLTSSVQEALKQKNEFQAELRIRNQNGQYRWFINKTTPVRLDETNEILMWVGSCTDIHSTKQMVQELLETNEQMAALSDQVQLAFNKAEAERKTLERLIIEAPAFFCILKGPQHRFELINDKYQQLLPAKNIKGRTVAEVMPEVVEQGYIQILDKVYQTGETFSAEEVPIKLDRQATGELEEIYVSFVYQAIYDENQQISGIMVCGNEVSENVKLRQQLQIR